MDDWYVECKLLLHNEEERRVNQRGNTRGSNAMTFKSMNRNTSLQFKRSLASIANAVVSFHYVSPMESRLLYELLSGQSSTSTQHTGTSPTETEQPPRITAAAAADVAILQVDDNPHEVYLPTSAAALLAMWPRGNLSIVGDYAQQLASVDEADGLLRWLHVARTELCGDAAAAAAD